MNEFFNLMSTLFDIIFSVEFLKIALPASGAVAAWFFNERSKTRAYQLQQKEERYKELLRCLKGFYSQNQDRALKNQFIDQIGLCWLYAPDSIILRANDFFESIHKERKPLASDEEKEQALANLILVIREDMLSRRLTTKTRLTKSDWKNFNA